MLPKGAGVSGERDWLQLVAWPVVVGSIPGGIGLWRWWMEREDKRAEVVRVAGQTMAERREAAMAAERDALTKDMRDLLERVEGDRDYAMEQVRRLRAEMLEMGRDRDRGWALARHYYRLAGSLLHALGNARAMVGNVVQRMAPPERAPEWQVFEVPLDMEAPIPRPLEPKEAPAP